MGVDDNVSAVAVQMETARSLKTLLNQENLDLAVTFVSFALEEPPAYGTHYMGSRVVSSIRFYKVTPVLFLWHHWLKFGDTRAAS